MKCSVFAGTSVFAALWAAALLQATTLQRLSFEQLTDTSDAIVTGKVTKTWSAWDTSHHYIWTHYTVDVSSLQKGVRRSTVELSEPGGVADGVAMSISGSVSYRVGDTVLVFLQSMPNGMLRTTGWGQGKYTVDSHGTLHAEVIGGDVRFLGTDATATAATPTSILDGLTVQEAGVRIMARLRSAQKGGGIQ